MKCNLKIIGGRILSILFAIFLTACGGGGGSDGGGGGVGNATITGTVAGTVVVAIDANGTEVDRDTATGTPKTFTIIVPVGGDYRFYLIENEGTPNERIYSLYQGTTNVFTISSAVTIDLGFVDTSTGVAVPANNPLDVSGVSSGEENTSVPPSLSGSVFTLSDLQGTWYGHIVSSGDSPQWRGWIYAQIATNASGNTTVLSFLDSDGNTTPQNSNFTNYITSAGIVTDSSNSSFHGVMNLDRNLIIATETNEGGGYTLYITQKTGGSFTTSDLQGTWYGHIVSSGDSPQWRGWIYAQIATDASGNTTVLSFLDSDGNTTPQNSNFTNYITSDGIVTDSSNPSYHGLMNLSKDLGAATETNEGGGYTLYITQKTGGSFTTDDLQGIWNFHGVSSGDSPQWTGWFYGRLTVDASGNATVLSFLDSDGNTTPQNYNSTLAITSDGIVTDSSNSSFHGVMNLDKNLIAATETNEGGGYTLYIIQK